MSLERTQAIVQAYLTSGHNDTSMLAPDVVFTDMSSGAETRGPEAIAGMLHYLYQVAFDANAVLKNAVYQDEKAIVEFAFVGKHIGEFAGVPATGKPVDVPLCVAYDLENDQIKRARIYFAIPAFLKQVGAMPGETVAA